MDGAIFLSAGVPDPKRGPKYAMTADAVAITAAISALIHVVLGRRHLVWGGHPAITPMIHVMAEDYKVDYGSWVTLYQSGIFRDEYPSDNEHFRNLIEIPAENGGREPSLATMRERMLGDRRFHAAVFVGGMQGILDEHDVFRRLQPDAVVVPLAATGGASLELGLLAAPFDVELHTSLNFVPLLHARLGVPIRERRFATPADQPADPVARL